VEERAKRIVETAIELAEKGGYEAVRLRDIATHAGVALGTVYKRFRSKEDILVTALEHEVHAVEGLIDELRVEGKTAADRAVGFFSLATRHLCSRPNLAKAIIKAMASGDPVSAHKVAGFQAGVAAMLTRVVGDDDSGQSIDKRTSFLLQQVWFSVLVGWMGGLHDVDTALEQMRYASKVILAPRTD
jgi:AcrR family transcriptional regulator